MDGTTQQLSERLLVAEGCDDDNGGIKSGGDIIISPDDDHYHHNNHHEEHSSNERGLLFATGAIREHNIRSNNDVENDVDYDGVIRPVYRDAPFAIAFIAHIFLVLFFAFYWGFSAVTSSYQQKNSANNASTENDDGSSEKDSTTTSDYHYSGLIWLCLLTCLSSIGISTVSLKVMIHYGETLIQYSLIGSFCFMVAMSVIFLVDGSILFGVSWLLFALLTIYYAKVVWKRIPFAAANLRTALSAIQTNAGVIVIAYGVASVAIIWMVFWLLAFIGAIVVTQHKHDDVTSSKTANPLTVLFLILSFYWTSQVFKNVLRVTVAGVVGTWWFYPQDALSVFSPSIVDSFRRTTTYSFGSIALGSLLVAIVQTLEFIANNTRRQQQQQSGTTAGSIFLCIVECLLRLISGIANYVNRWAYCYVGLYGYDYISSGKKAMELFEARGWTTIISDDLIQRTLLLVSVIIGALSGIFGMVLSKATGWTSALLMLLLPSSPDGGESIVSQSTSDGMSFAVCFIVGISVGQILIHTILSAVDTVIVAFAEAPSEFNTHHPALYNNMVTKWRLVYPEECGH